MAVYALCQRRSEGCLVCDRPRQKEWKHPRFISEHAFDKLRLIDCTFAEFDHVLETAEVIEELPLETDTVKQVLLVVDWIRPLHVVVVVDDRRSEERVVTIYEPDDDQWTSDYRKRR